MRAWGAAFQAGGLAFDRQQIADRQGQWPKHRATWCFRWPHDVTAPPAELVKGPYLQCFRAVCRISYHARGGTGLSAADAFAEIFALRHPDGRFDAFWAGFPDDIVTALA